MFEILQILQISLIKIFLPNISGDNCVDDSASFTVPTNPR